MFDQDQPGQLGNFFNLNCAHLLHVQHTDCASQGMTSLDHYLSVGLAYASQNRHSLGLE